MVKKPVYLKEEVIPMKTPKDQGLNGTQTVSSFGLYTTLSLKYSSIKQSRKQHTIA